MQMVASHLKILWWQLDQEALETMKIPKTGLLKLIVKTNCSCRKIISMEWMKWVVLWIPIFKKGKGFRKFNQINNRVLRLCTKLKLFLKFKIIRAKLLGLCCVKMGWVPYCSLDTYREKSWIDSQITIVFSLLFRFKKICWVFIQSIVLCICKYET